jgi:hypothetical protein
MHTHVHPPSPHAHALPLHPPSPAARRLDRPTPHLRVERPAERVSVEAVLALVVGSRVDRPAPPLLDALPMDQPHRASAEARRDQLARLRPRETDPAQRLVRVCATGPGVGPPAGRAPAYRVPGRSSARTGNASVVRRRGRRWLRRGDDERARRTASAAAARLWGRRRSGGGTHKQAGRRNCTGRHKCTERQQVHSRHKHRETQVSREALMSSQTVPGLQNEEAVWWRREKE